MFLFAPLFLICCNLAGCKGLDNPTHDYIPIKDETSPLAGAFIKKINDGIDNSFILDGKHRNGQGFAVYRKTAYRLYDSGVCQAYDFSDIEAPAKISSFLLGSSKFKNHSNCAQFGPESDGAPLLYISGLSGKCFVERMSPEGSELAQTLTLLPMEAYNISKTMNIICGDDGFLWAFGNALSGNTLGFAKLRRPDLSEGDIIFSSEDILDSWTEEGYVYSESVCQGGMVYKGLLYFLFGSVHSHSHIAIYNTETHQKVTDIDLDSFVREEPEDCEMVDGKLILTILGGKGYYILDLDQRVE